MSIAKKLKDLYVKGGASVILLSFAAAFGEEFIGGYRRIGEFLFAINNNLSLVWSFAVLIYIPAIIILLHRLWEETFQTLQNVVKKLLK